MAEQRMKVRDKKVQKMTKDGLVEENLTDKSSVRVSNRASDVQMGGKQGEKEVSLVDKSSRQSERSGKNIRPSVQKSRDAPELIRTEKQSEDFGQSSKQQNRKRIRAEVGKESRLAEESEAGQSGRLKEKRADLSENRGDSRRNQTGGSKKPKQKQRLKFAYEETGASVKNDKDMEKLNQMDTDGVNFRHQKQKEKAKKFSYEEAKKKKEAKRALQKELGLPVDDNKFMIAIISRLTDQKGLDLVDWITERIVDEFTQFVIIGTGESRYEDMFRYYQGRFPDRVSANIFYSDALAHKLYAAADAMLVPSRFEPCGLTQLISLRYGTVPIVRETGGLKDTVEPYNEFEKCGTGFTFHNYNADDLLYTINYAKNIYFNHR